ncbi:UNVERIFIED_CONTAM: hypothetical protein PYX00_005798 [Menopon gallinae]|uniref:peptidylprolyl isomerase n=1 Tax=Menopon gallinae TaxID=328185 RepID=A0AAW2HTH0_9NEOP
MTAGEEVAAPTLITPGPNAVDVTPNQDGGVLKEIIKEGEGDAVPAAGCNVFVHYEGKLTDGTVFDSSKSYAQPFEFTLGRENVIKAWDIAIATMKKGEVAILTCKPDYAYGDVEVKNIPKNSTLIFEVTLIDWIPGDISKDKDGGILKLKTYERGKGYSPPNDGAVCTVHLIGEHEGKVFEDREVKFNMGEGCEEGIVEGVERALKNFRKGEKSVVELKPKYAFKEEGNPELGVPPNATVQYTIELKDFEQPARSWDMTTEERIAQAKLLKEKATNYFKANKYNMAIKFYSQVTDYVNSNAGSPGEESEDEKALLLAARLNLGLVHLKLNQCYEAKMECDKALELDPQNVKGLFRRGQAYLEIGEPEKAKADFEAVLKIEPTNKLAASQIVACCNKIKQHREKEKKIYSNMFEKFARRDKEVSS